MKLLSVFGSGFGVVGRRVRGYVNGETAAARGDVSRKENKRKSARRRDVVTVLSVLIF